MMSLIIHAGSGFDHSHNQSVARESRRRLSTTVEGRFETSANITKAYYCVDRRSCSLGDNDYRVTVYAEQTWKHNDDSTCISLHP